MATQNLLAPLLSESSSFLMQSDRLMRGMHMVCNHDLPNQLFVLQGLLQMLRADEYARLSKDGQEYVDRLQNVMKRTSALARFLKEMEKLHGYAANPEPLALDLMARELQGSLKHQFPDKQFEFDWQWAIPSVRVDPRTFLLALSEILASLISASGPTCKVAAVSETIENQIAIRFELASDPAIHDNGPHLAANRFSRSAVAQSPEMVLAREWLAVSEASLEIAGNGGSRFTILVPKN